MSGARIKSLVELFGGQRGRVVAEPARATFASHPADVFAALGVPAEIVAECRRVCDEEVPADVALANEIASLRAIRDTAPMPMRIQLDSLALRFEKVLRMMGEVSKAQESHFAFGDAQRWTEKEVAVAFGVPAEYLRPSVRCRVPTPEEKRAIKDALLKWQPQLIVGPQEPEAYRPEVLVIVDRWLVGQIGGEEAERQIIAAAMRPSIAVAVQDAIAGALAAHDSLPADGHSIKAGVYMVNEPCRADGRMPLAAQE